jgi:hypothetical protein
LKQSQYWPVFLLSAPHQTLGLGQLRPLLDLQLKTIYPHFKLFNPSSSEKTKSASDSIARKVKASGACVVCGSTSNDGESGVKVAHILRNSQKCAAAGLSWDESNFILLCGWLGVRGTCHDLFDTGRMSFHHVKGQDNTHWLVVGGPNHGKEIIIPTAPHRRIVHAHLTKAIVNESLDVPQGDAADDFKNDNPPEVDTFSDNTSQSGQE